MRIHKMMIVTLQIGASILVHLREHYGLPVTGREQIPSTSSRGGTFQTDSSQQVLWFRPSTSIPRTSTEPSLISQRNEQIHAPIMPQMQPVTPSIASGSYSARVPESYECIQQDEDEQFDWILRNLSICEEDDVISQISGTSWEEDLKERLAEMYLSRSAPVENSMLRPSLDEREDYLRKQYESFSSTTPVISEKNNENFVSRTSNIASSSFDAAGNSLWNRPPWEQRIAFDTKLPVIPNESVSPASEMPDRQKSSLFITPKAQLDGSRIDVIAEMQRENIDFSSLGIQDVKQFPSGAVFFVFASEEIADFVRRALAASDTLIVQSKDVSIHEARIHKVPSDCTEAEISERIYSEYKQSPIKVRFLNYKDEWKKHIKIALISVENGLLKQIEESPKIRLRGILYFIETFVRVFRCTKCQLLGHLSKHCARMPRPPFSSLEPCVDCCYYNKKIASNPTQFRDTNHPTNDEKCPTKVGYIKSLEQKRALYSGIREELSVVSPHQGVVHKTPLPDRKRVVVEHKILGSGFDVLAEIQGLNINLASFGVQDISVNKSGSVFFQFEDEVGALKFQQEISKSELLEIKSYKTTLLIRHVRIYNVPNESTESEVAYSIFLKYREPPNSVKFLQYSGPNARRGKIAMIHVGRSLLQKMQTSPGIRIRGQPRVIQASVNVYRCPKCQLIGHQLKTCSRTARPPPSLNEPCLDCTNYNRTLVNAGVDSSCFRRLDHTTDDENCPTKKFYVERLEKRLVIAEKETKMKSSHTTVGNTPGTEASSQTEGNRKEDIVQRVDDGKVRLVIMPTTEGMDTVTEFRSLNVDPVVSEIENAALFPHGVIMIECRSARGAQYLQEMVATTDNLGVQTIMSE